MKQLYFFDDFLIRRTNGIKRVFHIPQWQQEYLYIDKNSYYGIGYNSIVPAPQGGYYLYYLTLLDKSQDAFDHSGVCLAHSLDGLNWESVDLKEKAAGGGKNVINLGNLKPEGVCVCFDPDESDPMKRYKMTNSPFDNKNTSGKRLPCILHYSPDGIEWTAEPAYELLSANSDTMLNIIKNDRTNKYQVTLRRRWGERRVFLTESSDLKNWSEPQLILHPEPIDPPGTHFYGLSQSAYGDMFTGFLWKLKMPYNDIMGGPVVSELVYSYDGRCWNRTHFDFMDLQGCGSYGGGSMYGTSIIETEDKLIVYSMAAIEQHHKAMSCIKDERYFLGLLPGFIRKEGLVGLAADSGMGEITTELLKLRDPCLFVNIKAPLGGVKFQITDAELNPIEGYTFEESEEIKGDYLSTPIRWKNQPDLSMAMQQPWIRLMIHMEQAELFAIKGDFVFNINPCAPIHEYL